MARTLAAAGLKRRRPLASATTVSTESTTKTVLVLGGFAESLVVFRAPLLRALVERGHRVVACAPSPSPSVIDTLGRLGVAVRDVPLERTGLSPHEDVRSLVALIRLFRAVAPDIVLSYTVKPVIYGSLAARVARVPRAYAMITGLGYAFGDALDLRGRLIRMAVRRLYAASLKKCEHVFFQNPDDKAEFERLGLVSHDSQAVLINGSGVDLDEFESTPLPSGPVSFLLIARLLVEKGVREYVEAARRIRASHPEIVFRLVGSIDRGNPASIDERELAKWVAEGVVEYMGWLTDVRPAIAASTVYVLPSYYREGTPRTVLEAMAMGRPIVTTDMPGCRETVQHGVNGYLVPARDVGGLVATLARFVYEPELADAMAAASRAMAESKYDVHKVNAVILATMELL